MKKKIDFKLLGFSIALLGLLSLSSCSSDDSATISDDGDDVTEEVDGGDDGTTVTVGSEVDETTLDFVEGNVSITVEESTLSNGDVAEVYVITTSNTTSIPEEHDMGPWCPTDISMNEDTDGGIWLDNDQVYQVTGDFISELGDFYDDTFWNLIEDDGVTIKYIANREDCENAAVPDVAEDLKNHCVQCLPEWFEDDNLTATNSIPVNPVKLDTPSDINGTQGIAFNGVVFDGPAPIESAILPNYTIAPFDNAGGHVNPFVGYHYHTATGMSKTVGETEDHTGMIGYALDGFGIYEYSADDNGDDTDLATLDECRGHEDDERGYHYHISAPGVNENLPCLYGATVQTDDDRGGPPM